MWLDQISAEAKPPKLTRYRGPWKLKKKNDHPGWTWFFSWMNKIKWPHHDFERSWKLIPWKSVHLAVEIRPLAVEFREKRENENLNFSTFFTGYYGMQNVKTISFHIFTVFTKFMAFLCDLVIAPWNFTKPSWKLSICHIERHLSCGECVFTAM